MSPRAWVPPPPGPDDPPLWDEPTPRPVPVPRPERRCLCGAVLTRRDSLASGECLECRLSDQMPETPERLRPREPQCKRCTEPCTTPLCWACLPTVTSMSAWDEGEFWTHVPGCDGYEVSTLGNMRRHGQPLALTPHPQRYPSVYLQLAPAKWRTRTIHQLALEAFLGTCPDGLQCCHWNDVKADNRLFNLRWDTPSANRQDAARNGRNPRPARQTKPNLFGKRGADLSELVDEW